MSNDSTVPSISMSYTRPTAFRLLDQRPSIAIDGKSLSIPEVTEAGRFVGAINVTTDSEFDDRLNASVQLVHRAIDRGEKVYGVTTGFGAMADIQIPGEQATALQNNLLMFLASGAGEPLDRRHVRTAMILRASVLAKGCSGIRPKLVRRMIRLIEADANPVVRQLGSIGASGDLVPLSTIARAVTGQSDYCHVQLEDRVVPISEAYRQLNLSPMELGPKEGLALVNGISFSASIAAHCIDEATRLLSVSLGAHGIMLSAMNAKMDPFHDFVHRQKPHPGQIWSASVMQRLMRPSQPESNDESTPVQDRYSVRCLPQYFAPIVEGLARITRTIETEMNSVSDNPLVDVGNECFHQSGNFLGQSVSMAMDDLRRHLGLLAKHLDVQIASLMAPEFNNGLPASLRGNENEPSNTGLKGVQILGNSIMPMLTYHGNPLAEHAPTHAEQFNQNINGLSWGSASLAWNSVGLFQHYLSVALIVSIQAIDLKAKQTEDHFDGRSLLSPSAADLYESVCRTIGVKANKRRPLIFDDRDQWLEEMLAAIHADLAGTGQIAASVASITQSFQSHNFDS